MSQTIDDSASSTRYPTPTQSPENSSSSWFETFFHSFFQEKNIKWMLIVGAAIVFGSSLMLVTKAWPDWSVALKYLTIVGYTSAIFFAAEITRRRLKLSATYHVLQSLTLLLLPVCFLSLTWLSAGTAVQANLHSLKYLGLLLPAIALLWLASTTILDHWLRGRQTTFLISFGLLCIAGALPAIASPALAFVFVAICWCVFTVGVVKVNRHTFWLAEQHQLPRIFGFLPIAMLGLQLVTLVGVKAGAMLPAHWIGFAVAMVAATILMTTRTVADVFRQRTGDLVRPLPWAIAVPLFVGLIAAVTGLGLSLIGFSYVGSTTYAVIPTSIVVAILMAMVARDTRHPALVWATLAVVALAYQCSPTLFADLVQMAKSATADAINQSRVPLSMYGLTYLPLLGGLALIGRRFADQKRLEFYVPVKQFVTVVSAGLFCVALADIVSLKFISPFLVSSANSVAFLAYAIVFRDRRYSIPATLAFVVACGTAIPAMNQMQYTDLSLSWVPTVLAGVALLMNVTAWPDRLVNRIAVCNDQSGRAVNGANRKVIRLTGCVLAVALAIHWIVSTAMMFSEALTLPAVLQFGFLMAALVRYTIRESHYFPAASVWVLSGYATLRMAAGTGIEAVDLVSCSVYALVGISIVSFGLLKYLQSASGTESLGQMRRWLGLGSPLESGVKAGPNNVGSGFVKSMAAFSLPVFDLSTIVLCSLVGLVYIPAVIIQHAALMGLQTADLSNFGWSTTAILAWLFTFAAVNRDRAFGVIAAMLLPLVVSSTLITAGFLSGVTELFLVWATVQCALTVFSHRLLVRLEDASGITAVMQVGRVWCVGLLAISCLSFDMPMRIVALISIASLVISFIGRWDQFKQCNLAILANVNVLLFAAGVGGCSGWVLPGLSGTIVLAALPQVFFVGCASVLAFEMPARWYANKLAGQWATVLRISLIPLMLGAFLLDQLDWVSVVLVMVGFGALITTELAQALKRVSEWRVWTACLIGGAAALFLYQHEIISFGVGISQLVLLTLSVVGFSVAHLSQRHPSIAVLRRPMSIIGQSLPALVACLAMFREFSGVYSSLTALNALSLMIAAGIYFHQAMVLRRSYLCLPALVIANAGAFLLWKSLSWNAPELYLVPIGISILGFAEVMKKELPKVAHTPLHYIGLLTVLCSPLPEVIGGSWGHIFALMVLSVVVILAAIGLRMRSLVYAGSAFLLTDLVAMVIRSTIHNVNLLWICGVVLGVGVIALAAFCENHRENLLSRIRMLSAELATWN
ncbi:hypothetical protein [Planctomycetes bacterium K23_9]|uniref:Uncharacterized protein n=1 Tax=Stieleria marina TaxID=1930275 RepID=A0A517NQV2_9BACT|nr:hypothetical protein K239x_14480 [Planctomycetes bacterium K23_9]